MKSDQGLSLHQRQWRLPRGGDSRDGFLTMNSVQQSESQEKQQAEAAAQTPKREGMESGEQSKHDWQWSPMHGGRSSPSEDPVHWGRTQDFSSVIQPSVLTLSLTKPVFQSHALTFLPWRHWYHFLPLGKSYGLYLSKAAPAHSGLPG